MNVVYPDTIPQPAFIRGTLGDFVIKQAVISFPVAAATGIPYKFASDGEIERNRIKAISISCKLPSNPIESELDDIQAWQVGSEFYNIPGYPQIADWFLTLKTKSGKILMNNMPLTRLTYFSGVANTGKLFAVDFNEISLTSSYVMKRGISAQATAPWVFVFNFYFSHV